MEIYSLQGEKFVIRDFDRQPPFTSFLPGLTGVKGIPMWSFYVNRGQGMASFGIHDKGNAMMEFSPANTGYETTQIKGFRTMMRVDGVLHQPFFLQDASAARIMEIERNVVTLIEKRSSLKLTVTYLILPGEDIGAVVRHVELENNDSVRRKIELLDGMPQVIPYGITNSTYKETSNLMRSWTDVVNLEENAPIFKMRASGEDSAEVGEITGGYYYAVIRDGERLPLVYDRAAVFGFDQTMIEPLVFKKEGLAGVLDREQVFANKIPCAFAPIQAVMEPGEKISFTAYAGYAPGAEFLNRKLREFAAPGFWEGKLAQARQITDRLTKDVRTSTADKKFDQYVEQCYLDNFLRGGYPFVFGTGEDKRVLHLFSRKHGDPERDYNFFSIAGEYYSQGNGNYRDVCQNRRHDVFFHPEIGDYDIRNFFSLVQLDGYNPLEIRPSTFAVRDPEAAGEAVARFIAGDAAPVLKVLEKPFTPGQITQAIAERGLAVAGDEEDLVTELLTLSDQRFEAGFGEGYWSDHFDYDLDLVEDYLSVWPDKKRALLFEDGSYRYYDSVGVVRPGPEKTMLSGGKVRQYGALRESEEKAARPGFDPKGTNWLKDEDDNVVTTNLFEKLLTLAANKMILLDPDRLGVSMEGGKPGWNDAMNGLPGLFGSSMPETLELRRVVRFLKEAVAEEDPAGTTSLLEEFADFLRDVYQALPEDWIWREQVRDGFRKNTELGVSGARTEITFEELGKILARFSQVLEDGVARALEIGGGIMPTFFTYEAVDFEEVLDEDGAPVLTPYGLPAAKVKEFRRGSLPVFLEGPARYLSSCGPEDRPAAALMAEKLKHSGVYDEKLKMYKTSESLEDQPMEIGRIRIFTPGWLERESVFLHMEYKYLVGLLKAGLYDQLFEAMGDALIPYLDPAVYGRSTLENSSFIATSVNPDPSVHGRGFQARLSGSTVEVLTLWKGMFVGEGGFTVQDGAPAFRFAPVLPGSLFDENGEAGFTLCGTCPVTYRNESRRSTYGPDGVQAKSITVWVGGQAVTVQGDTLGAELAQAVRDHRAQKIQVTLA